MSSVLRAAVLFLLVLLGAACSGRPAVRAKAPAPPPSSSARGAPPPWNQRLSVAGGRELRATDATVYAIKNATLMLATGRTIARGTIVLAKGKIVSVTEGDAVPAGATVIDGTGKFVTPGLIDTHSHIGVFPMPTAQAHGDGNEMTDPVTPQAQAVDGFWPQDPAIARAVAGGVTSAQILPGSGNLVGGRSFTIKLRPATSARAMHFEGAPDGLKMACGENPKRVYGHDGKKAPMTRMGNLALQRAAFLKAKKLARQWQEWRPNDGKDKDKKDEPPPDRDPGLETLAGAMAGRVLVHIHCYRADEMHAMLALADEVGFEVRSFHHALEAYKIRGEIASRGLVVSTWADWWGGKLEQLDGIPENAALVTEAGGKVAIHSDSNEGIQRLNQEAAKALAAGTSAGIKLTEEDALRWITRIPAWTLGVEDRVGSLEVGKDADVVVWSENPLTAYAQAERVFIDGKLVYTRGGSAWSDYELGDVDVFAKARQGASASRTTLPLAWPAPRASAAESKARAIAIVGGRLLGGKEPLDDATVIVQDGMIRGVGKGLRPPPDAEVIDARGAIITPGLVDPITATGIVEVALEPSTHDDDLQGTDPIRAAFRVADGYNPASGVIPVTRMEGITSVGVVPSGGLIAGQSAWADLDGARADAALAQKTLALHVDLSGAGGAGGHAGALRRLREAFDDARTYVRTRGAFERNQSRPFAAGRLDLEAVAKTLGGKMPVVFHVDRAAEILSALALAREFGVRPIIAGGAEAWIVRTELAAAKVPVIVRPLLPGPVTFDASGARDDNAALLHAAGVPLMLSVGDTTQARKLRQAAANAVRAGLPHEAALAALTRAPAEAFGIADRYGAIDVGKVANVVVWTGDPLSIQSRPSAVIIRGKRVVLRSRQTALFEKYRTLP